MIEVEIRGRLTEEIYERLKAQLSSKGESRGKSTREMYLLRDYPGYDKDPTAREVDLRLRNTDGFCEIMLKYKADSGNHGRREVSLALSENTLDHAKEIVKAMGCKHGLKMLREREEFVVEGVEWVLINCPPKGIKFYEAELTAETESEIPAVRSKLIDQARDLGAEPILTDEAMRAFLYMLDEQVNEDVKL
ncbi:MAG: CYTH domain-containing protein [Patescibacteria group bacterium]|nr:CYTH domain-containing protein [Patescibacteria group bacterium]